jgi:hypothetical protein
MSIGVYGDADAVMSELLLHLGEWCSLLNEQTRERMAEVMHPNVPQPGFCQQRAPHPVMNVRKVERGAGRANEYSLGHCAPSLAERLFLPFDQ